MTLCHTIPTEEAWLGFNYYRMITKITCLGDLRRSYEGDAAARNEAKDKSERKKRYMGQMKQEKFAGSRESILFNLL